MSQENLEKEKTLRPPDDLDFGAGGDFIEGGKAILTTLRSFQLKPTDSVLDIGCGIGRVAVALTDYLSPTARYEGFDVSTNGIRWCAENITSRYPNFRFTEADVYSAAGRYAFAV